MPQFAPRLTQFSEKAQKLYTDWRDISHIRDLRNQKPIIADDSISHAFLALTTAVAATYLIAPESLEPTATFIGECFSAVGDRNGVSATEAFAPLAMAFGIGAAVGLGELGVRSYKLAKLAGIDKNRRQFF